MHEFKAPLAKLIDRGLLKPDRFRGGYSLTHAGFVALRNCG
jgi:hypothetical protein